MFGPDAIHGELELLLRPLLRGTLAYVGMDVLPFFAGYHVPYLKPEAREQVMRDYRGWLASLPALEGAYQVVRGRRTQRAGRAAAAAGGPVPRSIP